MKSLCLVIIYLAQLVSCVAAVTMYTDRQAFLNATASISGEHYGITFNQFWHQDPTLIGRDLTVSNVTFTGYILLVGMHPQYTTSGATLMNFESPTPMGIHFHNGARAFGADYSSESAFQFTNFTATLTLDTGRQFTFDGPTNPQFTFFGWVSSQPIYDMTFSDGGKYSTGHEEAIRDIWIVSQVPEPGSLSLLACGLAIIFLSRRCQTQGSDYSSRKKFEKGTFI